MNVPARFLTILSCILAISSYSLANVGIHNAAENVSIEAKAYTADISHDGFQVTVVRAGEVILQSAGPSDHLANLGFTVNGAQQHITKLRSFSESHGIAILIYETSAKGISARVEIQPSDDRIRFKTWLLGDGPPATPNLRYRLDSSGYWYGGGFQGFRDAQILPLNYATIPPRFFFAQGASQGTPVWYSTKGVAIWIRTPYELRYSVNAQTDGKKDGLLNIEMPGVSCLSYDVLIGENIREVVRTINREIGFAKTAPSAEYFTSPIYTTWVEHKTDVSQAKVVEFAQAIRKNNLPAGVIEIDDRWEQKYGDLHFDAVKFPDPKAMTDELHRMGFRVTLWIHPFVNVDSETFRDPQIRPLLIKDLSGEPGLTTWWQGNAAVWDFTNPQAALKFQERLAYLQNFYGFDGFKFDGGDVNFLPIDLVPSQPITTAQYADFYNRETTAHFSWSETRSGVYSQSLGVVQRLIDKQSVWGKENGLAATLPEAILTSMRGFVYVMPDMVGGNQYDGDKIDKELLVRWAQASALMPLIQFSLGPWHFDDEALKLCREASELHVKFSPYIVKLANEVPKTGLPIFRPIWFNFPTDKNAEALTDEFMVGDALLVAPVLAKGMTSRDIYLPEGRWRDYKTGAMIDGGRTLKGYLAPLDTLPLFVNLQSASQLEPVH